MVNLPTVVLPPTRPRIPYQFRIGFKLRGNITRVFEEPFKDDGCGESQLHRHLFVEFRYIAHVVFTSSWCFGFCSPDNSLGETNLYGGSR